MKPSTIVNIILWVIAFGFLSLFWLMPAWFWDSNLPPWVSIGFALFAFAGMGFPLVANKFNLSVWMNQLEAVNKRLEGELTDKARNKLVHKRVGLTYRILGAPR